MKQEIKLKIVVSVHLLLFWIHEPMLNKYMAVGRIELPTPAS